MADLLRRGLLEACDDSRLFAFQAWPLQRKLLEAVERGPRIHVWAVGRRSGKSTLAAVIGLWDCLLRPQLDGMVRPGEVRYAVSVATNISQARLIINAARSIVERSPVLAGLIEGVTEDEIRFRLPSGARTALRAFPCSSRGGRGWPISCLVMDEAAHFLSESDGDRTADRVWGAMAPSTAQFGAHARIILASTPWGQTGLFADLHGRASAGEIEDAIAQHATTQDVNPTISAGFLALEAQRDPDTFRSEYLAEFMGSGDAYINFDRVDLLGPPTAKPEDAVSWVAGLDPAFNRDPFGVALVGRTADGRLVVGPVLALRADGGFSGPVDEIAEVIRAYNARAVTDQFCQAPVAERLRHTHGLQVRINTMTAQTKTDIFGNLRLALYDGSLMLPDHPALINELRRLRTKYSAGSAAILNPRVGGSHGDQAQALALAVHELSTTVVSRGAPMFAEPPSRSMHDVDGSVFGPAPAHLEFIRRVAQPDPILDEDPPAHYLAAYKDDERLARAAWGRFRERERKRREQQQQPLLMPPARPSRHHIGSPRFAPPGGAV